MPCLIKPDMHHTCLRTVQCLCGGCLPWLFAPFWCCFFGLVPITSRLWGSVRLRPFVFFMDSFFFLAGFQARWPLPLISLLSLLASCFVLSLCCATYHLFTMPPKPPCQPLTLSPFLANRCLTMLVRLHLGPNLLPSGISGKMTVTLDLTTIFAMLVVSMLSLSRATYHLFIKPPKLPW